MNSEHDDTMKVYAKSNTKKRDTERKNDDSFTN